MKFVKLIIAMAALAGFFLLLRYYRQAIATEPETGVPFSIEDARYLFPAAEDIVLSGANLYVVKDTEGRQIGYMAYGPPEDAGITGYAGIVPFLAGMDNDLQITGVHMLSSRETPGYAARVADEMSNAWNGLTPGQAAVKHVDAVSGATETSQALATGMMKTMGLVAGRPLTGDITSVPSQRRVVRQVFLLIFLAAAIASFFPRFSSPRITLVISIASIILPGILAASMLSIALLETWIAGPAPWRSYWMLMLVAFCALLVPLLTGRNFYCNRYCPFGAAQYLAGKVRKNKRPLGRKPNRILGMVRMFLVAMALFLIASAAGIDLSLLEPFAAFRWMHASWVSLLLALFFLALSVYIAKPWCRICPTGGIIEGVRKINRIATR